jgi:transposase
MRVKKRRDWLKDQARQQPDWVLFDEDESWFSRFAQPAAHAWALPGEALHLVQREPKRGEGEKALSCFGARRQDNQQVYLYFSHGQPNSEHMWVFIIALLAVARQEGKSVVVIIWDNASWHISQRIREWTRGYNQAAKAAGEPRLLVHGLPIKSPWLNPIEPCWIHAKRAVCEPEGDLTSTELRRRLCTHFNTEPLANTFKL